MIFSIALILVVGAIAFFHYLQGFFSATISAIVAVIAAVLALAWHEWAVETFLGGRFADHIHGLMLVIFFAVIYLVIRLLFDKMVPGNVRVSAALDKLGGGAMGLVAGLFAAGILAVAAQQLPFTPSIATYSRYETRDREVMVPTGQRRLDTKVDDELVGEEGHF